MTGIPCPDCGAELTPTNTAQCAAPGCVGRAHRYGPSCADGTVRIYCHTHQPNLTVQAGVLA